MPGVDKVIFIGELINATRKSVSRAIERRDEARIRKIIGAQVENGASYIDLNAGTGKGRQQEKDDMEWLVGIVNEFENAGVCIDSSDTEVIRHCLPGIKSRKVMINSISGEEKRIGLLVPLVKEHPECQIICLAMDDSGIPADVKKRVEISGRLISLLENAGLKRENIFIDALVQPVSTDGRNGIIFLESVRAIKNAFPTVMTTCGLSNVSFGLPDRVLINRYFLAIAVACGLDSAIADPLASGIREAACLAELLSGRDDYCISYIKMCRENGIR